MIPEVDKEIEEENNVLNEDDFFADFGDSVQEFDEPDIEEPDYEPDTKEIKKIGRINKLGAKTLVNTTDSILALIISIYALSDDSKAYQMEEESKSDIIDLVAEMFPESSTAIPGWMQLILVITAAYTPLFQKAHSDREINQKEKQIKNAEYQVKLKKVENTEVDEKD